MQVLYFARRDKKAVDVVARLNSSDTVSQPLAIHDISEFSLQIPANHLQKISLLQSKKVMDWQLYLENFKDHKDFIQRLDRRGYKGLPNAINPLVYSGEEIKKINFAIPKKMLQKRKN
jgi:hypothetical protein